jgi:hypothetical protein
MFLANAAPVQNTIKLPLERLVFFKAVYNSLISLNHKRIKFQYKRLEIDVAI